MKSFFFCALVATAAAAPVLQLTRTDGTFCRFENHGSIKSTCDISYKGNSIATLDKRLDSLEAKVAGQGADMNGIWAALTALESKWIAGQKGDLARPQIDQAALKKAQNELGHDMNQVNKAINALEKEVEANDVDIKNLQNTDVQHDARHTTYCFLRNWVCMS